MPLYTFYLHQGPDTAPSLVFSVLESKDQARAQASRLLADALTTHLYIAEDGNDFLRMSRGR